MGNVSSETEQHLKHEFRTLGRDASDSALASAVRSEIDRLSREAETLRKLRAVLFGVAEAQGSGCVSSVLINAFSVAIPSGLQSSAVERRGELPDQEWTEDTRRRHHRHLVVLTNNQHHNCHAKRHAECGDITSDVGK